MFQYTFHCVNHPGRFVASFEVSGDNVVLIGFDLVGALPHRVEINIYNRAGYLVAQPFTNNQLKPGKYSIVWQGTDANENNVAPGIYIVEYRTERDSTSQIIRWPLE